MTGLEFFVLTAIVGWVMAAPDQTTARTRGGLSGAARAGASAAKRRAQEEWRSGGPVRTQRRTARRTRMAATRKGRAGLLGERALIGAWRALRSGARIARAGVAAAPSGYRTGATRAVQQHTDRQARRAQRRAATQARRTQRFIDPATANPTDPAGTDPATTGPAGTDPASSAIVDPAHVPAAGEPGPAQPIPVQPVSDFCPVCGGRGYVAEGAGSLCPRCGGSGVTSQPTGQPDGTPGEPAVEPGGEPAGEPAGEVFHVPGVGQLTTVCGPPRTPYEATLDPQELAELRRLTAIREAGYTGWLDSDLQPVPEPGPAADWSTGAAAGEVSDPQAGGAAGETTGRSGQAGTPETTDQSGPADEKEITGMAEMGEFETTGDLRAEAAELEGIAEELAEQLAEFNRRKQALEEKVGAAPFGTRAISEAAAALSDSGSLEESQEALTELRVAVDASDAVADVTAAHEAKGNVEAFAEA